MSVNPDVDPLKPMMDEVLAGWGLHGLMTRDQMAARIRDLEAEVARLKTALAAKDEQVKFRNEAIAGWERIAQFWKTKSQEVEDRVAGHPVPPGQPDLRTPNPDGEDWYRVQDLQARMNRAERRLDVLEGVRLATRGDR